MFCWSGSECFVKWQLRHSLTIDWQVEGRRRGALSRSEPASMP